MSKQETTTNKRPDAITSFKLPRIEEEDNTQFYSVLGLGLGLAGLLLKNKYCSWAGLLANIISLLNKRASETDARSGISSITFSILGLVMLYAQMFTAPANSSIFDSQSLN